MRKPDRFQTINAWQRHRRFRYHHSIFVMDLPIQQADAIFEFFRGERGRDNYEKLVLYAVKLTDNLRFRSIVTQNPMDYVNEAIRRCLPNADGEHDRNFDAATPLGQVLRGIIRSLISHDVSPSDIRKKYRGRMGTLEEDAGPRDRTADDFATPMWNDRVVLAAGASIDDKATVEAFKNFVRSDEIVYRMVVLLLEEDIDEPAELVAHRIGIRVSEVYVARKRLERMCRRFANEGGNHER